ncbi:DUF4169 family protein [Ruegeria sp. 6PALISEP08]|uniref:DUF4169 family protein n=1 Tax=Ruegeria sp. 6PALISEP08 TaxID=1225660 RepID=UPI00067F26FD|nr:DUF4169 family protein [Ruegeria sp. 6PALISEP08]
MSTPINLNRFRKEKARAKKKALADHNAVTFGRTKAEKEVIKLQQEKQKRDLDNHELDE